MDGFGDNFDQADVDPAAEFLAREKDQLAGLEEELKATHLGGDENAGNQPGAYTNNEHVNLYAYNTTQYNLDAQFIFLYIYLDLQIHQQRRKQ